MPESILVAIAATLAGKVAASLYDVVRRKFAGDRAATATLEAADGATPDSPEVRELAEALADAAGSDPSFDAELRSMWNTVFQDISHDAVGNQVSGNVHGNVVQARDITGGVSF